MGAFDRLAESLGALGGVVFVAEEEDWILKRIVLEFRREKETKATFRYQEVETGGGGPTVGSIYIKKTALGTEPPEQVRVTIE